MPSCPLNTCHIQHSIQNKFCPSFLLQVAWVCSQLACAPGDLLRGHAQGQGDQKWRATAYQGIMQRGEGQHLRFRVLRKGKYGGYHTTLESALAKLLSLFPGTTRETMLVGAAEQPEVRLSAHDRPEAALLGARPRTRLRSKRDLHAADETIKLLDVRRSSARELLHGRDFTELEAGEAWLARNTHPPSHPSAAVRRIYVFLFLSGSERTHAPYRSWSISPGFGECTGIQCCCPPT